MKKINMNIKIKKSYIKNLITITVIISSMSIVFMSQYKNKLRDDVQVKKVVSNQVLEQNENEISIWIPNRLSDFCSNYSELENIRLLEEEMLKVHDVELKWIHPKREVDEEFFIMLESGITPDIIVFDWLRKYPGGPEKALLDGKIIGLNNLIKGYGPNIRRYLKSHPQIDAEVKTVAGYYYAFPSIREKAYIYNYGPVINKVCMEGSTIKEISSISDWDQMLHYIKDNNICKIPLAFPGIEDAMKGGIIGAFGISGGFYSKDGEVVYGPMQPEYENYLNQIRRWYVEKLIETHFFSNSQELIQHHVNCGEVGMAFINQNELSKLEKTENSKYIPIPYPLNEMGKRYGVIETQYGMYNAAISTECNKSELATQILDFNYSQRGKNLLTLRRQEITEQLQFCLPGDQRGTGCDYLEEFVSQFPMIDENIGLKGPYEEIWKNNGQEILFKEVAPLKIDCVEVANLLKPIEEYVSKSFVEFIVTDKTDADFEQFRDELKKLGIERVLEIYENTQKHKG